MLLNYETVIVGQSRCVLVPYRPEHVRKYHEWMLDPHLLEATASEPLSLQEEYEMQQSWRLDPYKCTFIILAKEKCSSSLVNTNGSDYDDEDYVYDTENDFIANNLSSMVGDVNLFLSDLEDDDDDENAESETKVVELQQPKPKQAELDIMIADASSKRKGLGREASCLMIMYGAKMLGVCRFFCKIKETNEESLSLFRSLGYQQCGYAECFGEVELELRRNTQEDMIETVAALLPVGEAGSSSGREDGAKQEDYSSLLQTFSCRVTTTSPEDDADTSTTKKESLANNNYCKR